VSTWCDQLIKGLSGYRFTVLSITGPHADRPALARPSNVDALLPARIWRRRPLVHRPGKFEAASFADNLSLLLHCLDGNLEAFSLGLLRLALLGDRYDLWDEFEGRRAWELVQQALQQHMGEPPRLGEVIQALHWLRASLVPLLFVPPAADMAHTVSGGLAVIPAWLAARLHGIPLVCTDHGVYLRERYLAFGAEGSPPAVKLLRARVYRALAELLYSQADRLTAVSEFNRQWQLQLGAPRERTQVIPNGVDPALFPIAPAEPLARPTVSWVGRVDPLKDLGTLIAAFAPVVKALPEALLRLFGPVPKGNEEYKAKLDSQIAALGLERNVRFEGPISPVYQAYHAGDVVALSSVSEGFPYTVIEAMMCGRPMVATRVGGVGEAVGPTGLLVPPMQPEAMAEALLVLLRDADSRKDLGEASRERALERYTLARLLDSFRGLYDECTNAEAREGVSRRERTGSVSEAMHEPRGIPDAGRTDRYRPDRPLGARPEPAVS